MPRFTDTYIKSLKTQKKRYEQYEGGGFGIRVSSNGLKSWIYRYKIDGKTDKLTLGHYPTTSLADAKKRFLELSGLRKDGHNPKRLLQREKASRTNNLGKLVMEWYTNYAEKNRRMPEKIKQQIDTDIIPLLGLIPLDNLEAIDITQALDKIVNRGAPVQANRILSTVKQALNYGVSRGNLKLNPAINIRARDIGGREAPRERVLTLDELKTIWLFLDDTKQHQLPLRTRSAIKILMLTGVRSSELRLARWNDISMKESLWVVPPENFKTGCEHKVHLSPLVKSILLELRDECSTGYVIYGKDARKPLTLNALPRAIKRIQQRIKIPHWTAHDLRRSFATHLGETLHINPVVIEKCLGHKMPRIMATYNKDEMLKERTAALEKWSVRIVDFINNNDNAGLEQTG